MDEDKEKKSFEEEEIIFEEDSSETLTLKKLREKLKKCVSEKQEYLEGWQRAKADFVNYKKEEEKRIKSSSDYNQERLLRDFLPIVDSFKLAKESPNWNEGLESIFGQFEKILKDHKVEKITELEFFSPVLHESVEMIPTDSEKEDGKIEKVLQDGYKIREKVLRPAKVQVKIYQSK